MSKSLGEFQNQFEDGWVPSDILGHDTPFVLRLELHWRFYDLVDCEEEFLRIGDSDI